MIGVVIVDDSPTFRLLARSILESDPDIQVLGEAINGFEALRVCKQYQPDIITMDIHMPSMDGYATIQSIMTDMPCPIIVLTGSPGSFNENTHKKAIQSGALVALPKPKDIQGIDPEADRLIEKIKSMSQVKVIRRRKFTQLSRPDLYSKTQSNKIKIIGIGASTGGPPAIQKILSELSHSIECPIVIVQHISQGFVQNLSKWLISSTSFNVGLAEHGLRMVPGNVYIAQDNTHLKVNREGRLVLYHSVPVDGHQPSVTVLFESIAQEYGPSGMGILLTGMGCDGAAGLKKMADSGSLTIAQDEKSSVVFGMPKKPLSWVVREKFFLLKKLLPL
ncbi:MAG: Chemotaxis response regulator protein-glutamate methylesterase [Candidatus Magnetoglobus multicellularis str. Araruama]|uniref:protein-glutamate methylesterase n=1 Tax=Candidatus Magnetoglobus multicellularis str. Araruama TaxID=890399 RepID=A0A1V1P7Y7_9BACT|nr:MAG: Chemotaxis response regulator protein-glutamate methylesterase [Candidatus Magnetoglobus multicellularis str. Araruama]